MFTVILLSETAKAIYEPARVYFKPYEEAGLIAFCDWDQSAQARTIQQAVPDLPRIIKGKAEWRALVVDHPRGEIDTPSEQRRDPENPFDYLVNTDPKLGLEHSPHALIRIAHVLLGYPQMSIKQFRSQLRYEDDATGEEISVDLHDFPADFEKKTGITLHLAPGEDLLGEDHAFAVASAAVSQRHNHVHRVFEGLAYSDDEMLAHEELSHEYRMKEVRPSEVVFVSTRHGTEEDEKALLQRAWKTSENEVPSRFVERNDYPPASRFAVYELLEPENSGYSQDLLRFWLGVLTVAKNLLPPSGFQADYLYEMGVEFTNEGLGRMLNEHISQLAMVRDHLDHVIRSQVRLPDTDLKEILTPVSIPVDFDRLGAEELVAPTHGYTLAADQPSDENMRWAETVGDISSSGAEFIRKPRRMVARSVAEAKLAVPTTESEASELTQFESDELSDELNQRLRDLVVPSTANLLNGNRMQRVIETEAATVQRWIQRRMRSRTIVMAVGFALALWVLALVPYLVQSGMIGSVQVLDAVLLTVLVLAVVVGVSVVTLFLMKRQLIRKIQTFNDEVNREVDKVRHGAADFSQYLTNFVTYRRGAEKLRESERAEENRFERLDRRRMLKRRVEQRIEAEKEIVLSLRGVELEVHRTSSGLVDLDPDDENVEDKLFRFPLGENRIPFNDSGEELTAPYDFVTRLNIHSLPIFEPHLPENSQRNSEDTV